MAVPKYYELFLPIMQCLSDEKTHHTREIRNACIQYFSLSDADLQEMTPSGKISLLNDRIGWAKTYLKKAGLISCPSRSNYKLTEIGQKAVQDGVENITLEYLKQFDSFCQFVGCKQVDSHDTFSLSPESSRISEQNPQEKIESAIYQINETIADDLMQELMKMSPYDFEKLVVLLLKKMGYGEPTATKKSGDEGIDGFVKADKFGFDTIYVQAKQWKSDSTVSRPEIQKFLGALAGQGASKGLFITTAKFSNEAIQFAQRHLQQKIVLVDGVELTKLMIEYNLGVSVETVYEVKRMDYDFFNEDL